MIVPLSRPNIEAEEMEAAKAALSSGWLTHGPRTTEFETKFARFIGVKHAIAMNSCASALYIALVVNKIRGEVILPSFTFIASANAVIAAGAIPIFADICPDTYNINPESITDKITSRTEAIMVVHYAGQSCNMAAIARICEKHQLLLIEDSAETLGGTFKSEQVGSFGVGCFSFFPSKNITTGEGGMLTTNDDRIAEKARCLISHGVRKDKDTRFPWRRSAEEIGFNFRMSNILAAVGVIQIDKVRILNNKRIAVANKYNALLVNNPYVSSPIVAENCNHVYQMYVIKLSSQCDRDAVVIGMRDRGIEASVHFDPPLHKQKIYTNSIIELPVTENVSGSVITLPMYPELSSKDIELVVSTLEDCLNKNIKGNTVI